MLAASSAFAVSSLAAGCAMWLDHHYHQMVNRPHGTAMPRSGAQGRIPREPVGAVLYLTTHRLGLGCRCVVAPAVSRDAASP